MRRLIPLTILIVFCVSSINASAQTEDRAPYIDENGNRIPWYVPHQDRGQTRSEVDISFAPAEMRMVGPSPEAARATKYSDYEVSYGLRQRHL